MNDKTNSDSRKAGQHTVKQRSSMEIPPRKPSKPANPVVNSGKPKK